MHPSSERKAMTAPLILKAVGSPAGLLRSDSTTVPGTSPKSSNLLLVSPSASRDCTIPLVPSDSPGKVVLSAAFMFVISLTILNQSKNFPYGNLLIPDYAKFKKR
jgi:hypothetical protein